VAQSRFPKDSHTLTRVSRCKLDEHARKKPQIRVTNGQPRHLDNHFTLARESLMPFLLVTNAGVTFLRAPSFLRCRRTAFPSLPHHHGPCPQTTTDLGLPGLPPGRGKCGGTLGAPLPLSIWWVVHSRSIANSSLVVPMPFLLAVW